MFKAREMDVYVRYGQGLLVVETHTEGYGIYPGGFDGRAVDGDSDGYEVLE